MGSLYRNDSTLLTLPPCTILPHSSQNSDVSINSMINAEVGLEKSTAEHLLHNFSNYKDLVVKDSAPALPSGGYLYMYKNAGAESRNFWRQDGYVGWKSNGLSNKKSSEGGGV